MKYICGKCEQKINSIPCCYCGNGVGIYTPEYKEKQERTNADNKV